MAPGEQDDLQLDGPLWTTGALQVDLSSITSVVAELAVRLRAEAAARKALEAAIEPLIARGGESVDPATGAVQEPESLPARIQRLEQEAYRQRQLEAKAILEAEQVRLQVDSLGREVTLCRSEAQQAGKDAASAAISSDMQRINDMLMRVGNATQKRISLLEEQLGIEPPEGFDDLFGETSAGEGAEGDPENAGADVGPGGEKAKSKAKKDKGPGGGDQKQRKKSPLEELRDQMNLQMHALREELAALGIPIEVPEPPGAEDAEGGPSSTAGADAGVGGENAQAKAKKAKGSGGGDQKQKKKGPFEELRDQMNLQLHALREELAALGIPIEVPEPPGAEDAEGGESSSADAGVGSESAKAKAKKDKGSAGGDQKQKKKSPFEELREEMDQRFRDLVARMPPQLRNSLMKALPPKAGGIQPVQQGFMGSGVAGQTIPEGSEGQWDTDGDEDWDLSTWKKGMGRWMQQQVALARKEMGLSALGEEELDMDSLLGSPGARSPGEAAESIIRELRPRLGLPSRSDQGAASGAHGPGGNVRDVATSPASRDASTEVQHSAPSLPQLPVSGEGTSEGLSPPQSPTSPTNPSRRKSIAADLADKFKEELAPWLAQQKGELGIDFPIPGFDVEMEHPPSQVGGGGFAVTEILAQARREIIQGVRREIAPWVGQQAKRLEGYKNIKVDDLHMASEADFNELVSKVLEQMLPALDDMQAEDGQQMRGASFGLLKKLQEELQKVKDRVEDVVHLSKRRMNGGFVEDHPEPEVQKQIRELNETLEVKHTDTQDHVDKVSKAVKGAQRHNELTGAKLDDLDGRLDELRSRIDLALPQLFRSMDALARRTKDMASPASHVSADADTMGVDGARAEAAEASSALAGAGGAGTESVGALAGPVEGSPAVDAALPPERVGAPETTTMAPAPGGGDAAGGGDTTGNASIAGPGATSEPRPELELPHLEALRELLDGASVPKPFASADDVGALKQAVDAAEAGTQSELGQLRQELIRALGSKADARELRSLSERLEAAINDIRRVAQVVVSQSEDTSENAALFRVPPAVNARCVSCNAKVDVTFDKRNPWDKGVLPTPPWPSRRFPGDPGISAGSEPGLARPPSVGRLTKEPTPPSPSWSARAAGGGTWAPGTVPSPPAVSSADGAFRRPRRDQSLPALDRSR